MIIKKKSLLILSTTLLALAGLYFIGPRPARLSLDNSWPEIPDSADGLADCVHQNDAGLKLRPDNQSRIIWNDEQNKAKTPVAMLYLHGFSASWFEGEPLHRNLSREFGMNLYIPRLQAHGIDTSEPLLDMHPDALYRSALLALAITEKLGERVLITGTSTGASLALMLTAAFPEKVSALILLSPNIRLADPNAWMLTKPWGLQIARIFMGSGYRNSADPDPTSQKYWYTRYRLEGLVALQHLLDSSMGPQTFSRVSCPVFMGYYYRDHLHQDQTVSVSAMLSMFDQLGTKPKLKTKEAFPDASVHVIGCGQLNLECETVCQKAIIFIRETLNVI